MIFIKFNIEIFWAPSDLIVPLGQDPAVFQCSGQGSFLLWWIDDDLVVRHEESNYDSRGFSFMKSTLDNGTKLNTLTIAATVENNNTRLRCHATGDPGPVTSENASLAVAGKVQILITIKKVHDPNYYLLNCNQ